MKFSRYTTIQSLDNDNYIMINALSGAIDIVDAKSKNVIDQIKNNGEIENADSELIDSLKTRAYLFDNTKDEESYISRIYDLYKKVSDKKMAKIVICPTFLCNLRCVYCFESEEIRESNNIIEPAEIDKIFEYVDKIVEMRGLNGYEVELFGGEPLLPSTYETNKRIFELARERKKYISIITNGTNIETYLELLSKYRDCVEYLQITIDGIKEIHDVRRIRIDKSGTFDQICNGVTNLLNEKIKVAVRINLDRQNIDSLKALVELFEKKGWADSPYFHADVAPVVDHICADLSGDIMNENEIIRRLHEIFPEKIKERYFNLHLFRVLNHVNHVLGNEDEQMVFPSFHYCEGNRMEFFVFAPDGKIYLCPEAVGATQAVIGEYKNGLKLYPSISQWENRSILTVPKCKECEIAPFCGGGCPYASIALHNDINEPVCDNSKEVLADYIETIKNEVIEKYC